MGHVMFWGKVMPAVGRNVQHDIYIYIYTHTSDWRPAHFDRSVKQQMICMHYLRGFAHAAGPGPGPGSGDRAPTWGVRGTFPYLAMLNIFGRSWGHLRAVWAILGPSWGHLGPSWGHLGPSQGHLEAILGHLGAFLGPSWGQHGAILGPSWTKFEKGRAKEASRQTFLSVK